MAKPSTLWQQFWNWSAPGLSEGDAGKILAARTLHAVLIGVLIWLVFYFAVGMPFFVIRKSAANALAVLLASAALTSLFCLRKGRIRLGSWIFLAATWSINSILTLLSGGFNSPALACFLAITVMATWLLGQRIALAFGGVLLAAAMALAILMKAGHHLPTYFPVPPMGGWIVLLLAVGLTVMPLNEVLRTIRESLEQARQQVARLKRAEEALQQSERNYREIFDNVSDAIFIHAAETGTILDVNNSMLRMFGLDRKTALALTPNDTSLGVTPYSATEARQWLMKALTAGPQLFEWQARKMDGKLFWVEISLRSAEISGQRRVLALVRDIAERKRAEEKVKESETKLRALFEGSIYPMGLAKEGVSIMVNPAYIDLFGYSKTSEVIGNPLFDDIAPEERPRVQEFARRRSTGEPLPAFYETRGIKRDGTVFDMAVGVSTYELGGEIYTIGILRDITKSKQAEEALRASEEQFRRIFQHSGSGMVLVSPNFHFLQVNDGFCKFLGYTESELLGKTFQDVTFPEDRPVGGGMEAFQLEKRFLRKDGTVVWGLVDSTLIRDGQNKPLHFVTQIQDFTKHKRAEEEKKTLEAQFVQAQKMESVGRLAGGVAHDFNNMLGVILGHAEMALEQVDPTQPLHEDLTKIRQAAERSADLTRQLLAFARKQTIAPVVLDLNATVAGMLNMLKRLIGEDIDINWQPQEDLWPVKVDPSQIDQILANLVVNARDALSRAGKIIIKTVNVVLDDAYCATHVGSVPGEYALLTVADNGVGMSSEVLDHIFEPFFTTKKAGQGTGLGLATVYGIVKQNRGFIDVESEQAKGTTFRIYMPRFDAKTGQAPEKKAAKKARGGKETILLVEDNEQLLNLCKRILERLGYPVLAASSPEQAIHFVEEHDRDIHLLISDVVMPEMNGGELAEKLFALQPGMKCLYMSGHTADVIAHQGVLDERVNFIHKPFRTDELAAAVRSVLEQE